MAAPYSGNLDTALIIINEHKFVNIIILVTVHKGHKQRCSNETLRSLNPEYGPASIYSLLAPTERIAVQLFATVTQCPDRNHVLQHASSHRFQRRTLFSDLFELTIIPFFSKERD